MVVGSTGPKCCSGSSISSASGGCSGLKILVASLPALAMITPSPPGCASIKSVTSYTFPYCQFFHGMGIASETHVDDDPAVISLIVLLHLVIADQLLPARLFGARQVVMLRAQIVQEDC